MTGPIRVVLAYAPGPRQVDLQELTLPAGATVRDALDAAGLLGVFEADWRGDAASVGIWGRKAALDGALRDGDRVELWRGLRVDPKRARRERFGRQGAGSAGLFAKRRPGAKPGY